MLFFNPRWGTSHSQETQPCQDVLLLVPPRWGTQMWTPWGDPHGKRSRCRMKLILFTSKILIIHIYIYICIIIYIHIYIFKQINYIYIYVYNMRVYVFHVSWIYSDVMQYSRSCNFKVLHCVGCVGMAWQLGASFWDRGSDSCSLETSRETTYLGISSSDMGTIKTRHALGFQWNMSGKPECPVGQDVFV